MTYSFWCSRCKVDHAGECPPAPAPVTLVKGTAIQVGSMWMVEKLIQGVWSPDVKLIFEIMGMDPANAKEPVMVQNVHDGSGYNFPFDVFDPAGVAVYGIGQVRLVEIPGRAHPNSCRRPCCKIP